MDKIPKSQLGFMNWLTDIYEKSTPEEWEDFKKQMETFKHELRLNWGAYSKLYENYKR